MKISKIIMITMTIIKQEAVKYKVRNVYWEFILQILTGLLLILNEYLCVQ